MTLTSAATRLDLDVIQRQHGGLVEREAGHRSGEPQLTPGRHTLELDPAATQTTAGVRTDHTTDRAAPGAAHGDHGHFEIHRRVAAQLVLHVGECDADGAARRSADVALESQLSGAPEGHSGAQDPA